MNIFSKYTSNKVAYKKQSLEPELWSFLEKLSETPATIKDIALEFGLDYGTAESFIKRLIDLKVCVPVKDQITYHEWNRIVDEGDSQIDLAAEKTNDQSKATSTNVENSKALISFEIGSADSPNTDVLEVPDVLETEKAKSIAFEIF